MLETPNRNIAKRLKRTEQHDKFKTFLKKLLVKNNDFKSEIRAIAREKALSLPSTKQYDRTLDDFIEEGEVMLFTSQEGNWSPEEEDKIMSVLKADSNAESLIRKTAVETATKTLVVDMMHWIQKQHDAMHIVYDEAELLESLMMAGHIRAEEVGFSSSKNESIQPTGSVYKTLQSLKTAKTITPILPPLTAGIQVIVFLDQPSCMIIRNVADSITISPPSSLTSHTVPRYKIVDYQGWTQYKYTPGEAVYFRANGQFQKGLVRQVGITTQIVTSKDETFLTNDIFFPAHAYNPFLPNLGAANHQLKLIFNSDHQTKELIESLVRDNNIHDHELALRLQNRYPAIFSNNQMRKDVLELAADLLK